MKPLPYDLKKRLAAEKRAFIKTLDTHERQVLYLKTTEEEKDTRRGQMCKLVKRIIELEGQRKMPRVIVKQLGHEALNVLNRPVRSKEDWAAGQAEVLGPHPIARTFTFTFK